MRLWEILDIASPSGFGKKEDNCFWQILPTDDDLMILQA